MGSNLPDTMLNVCTEFFHSDKTGGYFGNEEETPRYYLALRKQDQQLEITNIRIEKPNRSKGYFTQFLQMLHEFADNSQINIKFSSVQNPILKSKLERSGYSADDLDYQRELIKGRII